MLIAQYYCNIFHLIKQKNKKQNKNKKKINEKQQKQITNKNKQTNNNENLLIDDQISDWGHLACDLKWRHPAT